MKSTVTQTTPEPVVTLTLELSREEARQLKTIVNMIVGPDSGPRGLTSKIYNTLGQAGIHMVDIKTNTVGEDRLYVQ